MPTNKGFTAHKAANWILCMILVVLSYCVAWLLRFEFSIPASERAAFITGLLTVIVVKGVVLLRFRPELNRWSHHSGFADLVEVLKAIAAATPCATLALYALLGPEFPRSVYLLDPMLCVLTFGAATIAARLYHEEFKQYLVSHESKNVLVYGAGVAGLGLVRELRHNPQLGYRVIGFIDDDPKKLGRSFLGVPVLGSGAHLSGVVDRLDKRDMKADEIVVAMPSATGSQIRAALERGRATNVPSRIVPGLGELISGKLHTGSLREISVTDLLGRERVDMDAEPVLRAVANRVVMVTGAAGSIGTELCNQLAAFEPAHLIALDQAESEMFRLEADLREKYPGLRMSMEVADIRDARRVESIIEQFGVDAIYHAAAYKHVPVMEHQACEAVRNNVLGTWILAQAAWRLNVSRFLLISTDKAVNPSSIMGLTKRIAELIVSASRPVVGRGTPTRFVSVRFGNVLVSNGSVVPIFQKQIGKGGPITVTHPDVRRYFMTVQEAVQLVLQASVMGKGSEVYVLDMGKPVKIVELAKRMITLSGLEPEKDIEIRFVGLRPGEKLFEEISLDSEHHLPTNNDKIRVFQGQKLAFESLVPWINELEHHLWRDDAAAVVEQLKKLVPEYEPDPLPEPAKARKPETALGAAPAAGAAGRQADAVA